MSIDRTELENRISDIVGDSMGQIPAIITLEVDNVVRKLTRKNIFYWNTEVSTGLSHTSGVITVPSYNGKILAVFDEANTSSSLKYYPKPVEQFQIAKTYDSTTNNVGISIPTTETYFTLQRDSNGNETINLHRAPAASTTFTVIYSKIITTLSDIVPDRLYTYILAETVATILLDQESSDVSPYYSTWKSIAQRELEDERDMSVNKFAQRYQNKAIPDSHTLNIKSEGF